MTPGRVSYAITGAQGTVHDTTVLQPDFAGDLAGPWSYVHFDDGLQCWCPDAQLRPLCQHGTPIHRYCRPCREVPTLP